MLFLNECLPENAGGDVVKILEVPSQFEGIENMVDGFSGFNNLKANITESIDTGSVALEQTFSTW